MANVVGVKPIRWSTRLGMTELKNASSTRCADADAGTDNKASHDAEQDAHPEK